MDNFMIDQEIELRLLQPIHAEELFNLIDTSRDYLREWLPWIDFTKEVRDSREFIEASLQQYHSRNGFQAGIWYKGELAGVIGLHDIDWTNKSTSIGYWLGETFQGKGLMTKACEVIIDHCFKELKLKRIEIRVATENYKSQAIPERLGFKKEGCQRSAQWLNDRFVDLYIYGLVNETDDRL